jgi:hypothetical protein
VDHPFSLLLAAVVCIATVLYIATPLRRRKSTLAPADGSTDNHATLLERRDALLRDLKDLEFDRNTGKISDADYTEMRAATAEAASAILQKLETGIASPTPSSKRRLEIEAEVEVLIARARHRLTREPATPQTNGVLPDAVLTAAFQAGGWACASCGRVMGKYDRFCASCGATRPE